MKLSFKYSFILSFVTIEIIFISLIVFLNFNSLNKLSHELIEEKIHTSTTLFTKLIAVPLVTYDLAALDNSAESFVSMKNIAAVKIIDLNNKVISQFSNNINIDNFNKELQNIKLDNRTFRLQITPIKIDGNLYGYCKILFEITQSLNAIEKNKNLTYLLIVIEILISMVVAYIVGLRVSKSLMLLSTTAEKIAADEQSTFVHIESSNSEISILSKSLQTMQKRIKKRNSSLNNSVSQLQESSHELKREKDFQAALIDSAYNVIIIMNTKGEIVVSNKIVEDVTGFTHDELQGKIAWEVFIPKDLQENDKKRFLNLRAANYPNTYENEWIARDGKLIPFAWSNSCIVDDDGEVEFVIAIGMDITQRKKSDETIRALINSPTDSMVLISMDGKIIEINAIAAKRIGKTVEGLIGKDMFQYCSGDLKQTYNNFFYEAIVTKKPVMFEHQHNERILENHIFPILNEQGLVTQISVFSRDITDLRKTQSELNRYIELVDENIITSQTDVRGIITQVSEAFCKISGYSKQELIGTPHSIVRDKSTPSSLYEDMWQTIQDGNEWHGEVRNKAKDGHKYWVKVNIYPSFDSEGNISGYYAIRQDITDKKIIEELAITDQLTSLYNRRHFDNIFSHELNRSKRENKVFCFMLFDVDNFKLYNDTYGHPMGDVVLSTIGNLMNENVKRSGDFAFRLGGEEFGVIYSTNSQDDGVNFTNKICKSIENKKILHSKNTASDYVTASFGLVLIDFTNDQNNEDLTQDSIYQIADKLLYEAKESGRNKVLSENV